MRVRDVDNHVRVLELLDLEEGLSDWALKFIESIVKNLESGMFLTVRQKMKLDELYEEHIERRK